MKKVLSVLLLLAMCASLFACTPETPSEQDTTDAPDTQAEQTDPADVTTEADTQEVATPGQEETTAEPEPPAPSPVALYQLAPEKNSLLQSYVIKTENGKLIVIDGGVDGAGKDHPAYMPAALRAIAGVGEGDYFEVEAWFLSHAHKDHM